MIVKVNSWLTQAAFKAWFVCVLLEVFHVFPVNPYYDPLVWFMIHMYATLTFITEVLHLFTNVQLF